MDNHHGPRAELVGRIEALEAENAALREALASCIAELESLAHSEFDGIWADSDFDRLTARFRAALAKAEGEG